MLADLPTITVPDDREVRHMIRSHKVFGPGIGYVDAHLLASVLLSTQHTLWTRDKKLLSVAQSLGVAMVAHLH